MLAFTPPARALALAILLQAAAPAPPAAAQPAADSVARVRQREAAEMEKVRADIDRVRAETKKVNAETKNLENGFLVYAPVVTLLLGIVGVIGGGWKYLLERAAARRQEIHARIAELERLLAGEDAASRITAAVSLGVLAEMPEKDAPGLRRQVVNGLFAHLATARDGEQAVLASVLNGLLARETAALDKPPLGRADLSHLSFDGRTLRDAGLAESTLGNTSFRGATLERVRFDKVKQTPGTRVDFAGCTLRNVTFCDADLTDLSFDGATVEGLRFERGSLNRCTFHQLKGSGTLELEGCTVLAALTFEGTDVSRLTIRNAGDVLQDTVNALARAPGAERATLDPALRARVDQARQAGAPQA